MSDSDGSAPGRSGTAAAKAKDGDGLTVTTGSPGRVIVASDTLLAQIAGMHHLTDDLRSIAGSLDGLMETLEPPALLVAELPAAAVAARKMADAARELVRSAADRSHRLAGAVMTAVHEYGDAEERIGALGRGAEEGLAFTLGVGARLLGVPIVAGAGVGILLSALLTGRSPSEQALLLQSFLKQHGRILTNRGTVALVRAAAGSADGFGDGLLLMPPGIAAILHATGVSGVSSSANTVVGVGRVFGLLKPTSVTATKTSSFEFGEPPTSLVQRSESFPNPHDDPGGEQIRIDRYVQPGKPDRFDVYIAGTVTFDPKTAKQPFDFQSDLAGVGGQSTASYQGVADALRQAGVTGTTPVVFNGYSQGGLLASQLAASGQYDVHGVVTFGAPSAQVHIPASIPVLSVRNSEDLVPATSGFDVNPHAVVVSRSVFDDRSVPSDWAVPAHRLEYYQETAGVIDDASSPEVRGVLDPLNRFGDGATRVDSTLWVATRVP